MRSLALLLIGLSVLAQSRKEAEYYLSAYAGHYGVPLDFARAIVQQESGWKTCARSQKGALGLMQLMPQTAQRLGVSRACDLRQNVSGGIRYMAFLLAKFHGDLRLVAAAYYAGEGVIERHGLNYRNPDVLRYVSSVRQLTLQTAPQRHVPIKGVRNASNQDCLDAVGGSARLGPTRQHSFRSQSF